MVGESTTVGGPGRGMARVGPLAARSADFGSFAGIAATFIFSTPLLIYRPVHFCAPFVLLAGRQRPAAGDEELLHHLGVLHGRGDIRKGSYESGLLPADDVDLRPAVAHLAE